MTVRLIVSDIFRDDIEGSDSSEPFLFILPAAGRRALLSISEQLDYAASWVELNKHGGMERIPLSDRQRAIIDATRDGLLEFEQVNEIVEKLEEIRAELELLRGATTGDDYMLDLIATGVGAIDPRLGILIEAVNAVENIMGGSWEPPVEMPPPGTP